MSSEHHKRGGASLGVLSSMQPWEAELILNLRLWCDGPEGQQEVWNSFTASLPLGTAKNEMEAFERLIRLITSNAHRPLVRHNISCACAGSDECVFAHLVTTASDGHLSDAALIASLLVSPAQAEHVALLAAQVGTSAKKMTQGHTTSLGTASADIIRIH